MTGIKLFIALGLASVDCAAAFRKDHAARSAKKLQGACSPVYGQCGGKTWEGPACCQDGAECVESNEYYSQCQPSGGANPTPAPSAEPTPAPTPIEKPKPSGANIFKGKPWYVNPSYRTLLESSINQTEGNVRETLESMQNIPSAFWIDVKSKIYKGQGHDDLSTVEGILEDAAACDPPSLVTLIVYDLPNRDCYALASNGEICCHYGADVGRTKCDMNPSGSNMGFYKEVVGGGCVDGLTEYREEYIDPFAEVVAKFSDRVPIVLIIEPDSLGNMVTNMANEKPGNFRGCHKETQAAYEQGIKYAAEKLSTAGATLYLDAAHGGWLGWANPGADKAATFAEIIASLDIHDKIRGFATNVANYQPVGSIVCDAPGTCRGGAGRGFAGADDACCSDDPCELQKEWNWGHNEVNYIDVLDNRMRKAMPGFEPAFIIDTGRNGNAAGREDCSAWCNPRMAGVGFAPTTATADSRIDAYFWLKTPGESDGCTEELPGGGKCPRFDRDCADEASLGSAAGEPLAPEAGIWFHYQMAQLAEHADLGDISSFRAPGSCGSLQA